MDDGPRRGPFAHPRTARPRPGRLSAGLGLPDRGDRYLELSDYIDGYVRDAIEVLRDRHDDQPVNLVGVCQGGVTSLCYAALYPQDVRNLITMVTPVDFSQGDEIVAMGGGPPIPTSPSTRSA